ncbi:MAG: hypothetical protein WCZ23_15320 [Rhodospirillaceae bacterium]
MTIEIFPTLHFLARPGLTPSLLAFTRSGSATRMGPRGWVEAVAADALRHDYDPVSGVYLGWLVEESRTNLALHARDQSVAPWTRTNMNAARTALGLDGVAASATTLTATLAGAAVYQPVTAVSATYTLSVDLRRVTGSGAVSLTLDGGASWFAVTVGSTRYGRLTLTQTLANPTPGLKLDVAGDVVAADYWQLEAGSFATSRIPTTTAPMTRGADLPRLDPAGAWFNPAEGTVYIDAIPHATSTAVKNLFSSSDSPKAVEFSLNVHADGVHANIGAIGSGFAGATPSGMAVAPGAPVRVALAYGPLGGAIVQNGSAFQSFATGSSWNTTGLAIGHQLRGGAQRWLNGHVRHVAVFPRRLGNAQLAELTTF